MASRIGFQSWSRPGIKTGHIKNHQPGKAIDQLYALYRNIKDSFTGPSKQNADQLMENLKSVNPEGYNRLQRDMIERGTSDPRDFNLEDYLTEVTQESDDDYVDPNEWGDDGESEAEEVGAGEQPGAKAETAPNTEGEEDGALVAAENFADDLTEEGAEQAAEEAVERVNLDGDESSEDIIAKLKEGGWTGAKEGGEKKPVERIHLADESSEDIIAKLKEGGWGDAADDRGAVGAAGVDYEVNEDGSVSSIPAISMKDKHEILMREDPDYKRRFGHVSFDDRSGSGELNQNKEAEDEIQRLWKIRTKTHDFLQSQKEDNTTVEPEDWGN